jgi:hypothetical protein
MTGDLYTRIMQHKAGVIEGFSKTYGCNRLVHYAGCNEVIATGKTDQIVAAKEEDRSDRKEQSSLGRSRAKLGKKNEVKGRELRGNSLKRPG